MKLFTTALIALTLTACGSSDQMSDSEKQAALTIPETVEGLPDFRSWQVIPKATDSCFQIDTENVHCMTEFTMDVILKNCSDATFKFIAKKDGYMYVQTLEHVFIRQGEYHRIEFEGKAEIYNITDNSVTEAYHVFRCYGSNGEVIKL